MCWRAHEWFISKECSLAGTRAQLSRFWIAYTMVNMLWWIPAMP